VGHAAGGFSPASIARSKAEQGISDTCGSFRYLGLQQSTPSAVVLVEAGEHYEFRGVKHGIKLQGGSLNGLLNGMPCIA
jgi:hypothetical protein